VLQAHDSPNRKSGRLGDWDKPGTRFRPTDLCHANRKALTFDLYWDACPEKRPSADPRGDNIYKPDSVRKFVQVENGSHDAQAAKRDLSANRVLISNHFYYFGRTAPTLPPQCACLLSNPRRRAIGGSGRSQITIAILLSFSNGLSVSSSRAATETLSLKKLSVCLQRRKTKNSKTSDVSALKAAVGLTSTS
jgi:Nucleotide modification associated domain 2